MRSQPGRELRRRSVLKTLLWRVIGIVWTWIGAYLILLLIPPSRKTAALIATLIVIYHHSTRMIMYYCYERIWVSVSWGRAERSRPMTRKELVLWVGGTLGGLFVILLLTIYVSPKLKGNESADRSVEATTETVENEPAVAPHH